MILQYNVIKLQYKKRNLCDMVRARESQMQKQKGNFEIFLEKGVCFYEASDKAVS